MYPLLNGSGTMFMQNIAKDEILNVFFALLERSRLESLQELKVLEAGQDCVYVGSLEQGRHPLGRRGSGQEILK